MIVTALLLLPLGYPRVLYGASCVGNVSGDAEASFSRTGFGDKLVELTYREVTNSSWSDSAKADGMSLTTEGSSKDGVTILRVTGRVTAAHYSSLQGTWGIEFINPAGIVRSHIDVTMSGTVAARGVNQKFPAFYAESKFRDTTAHADRDTPTSTIQINRHWSVERLEGNNWHEYPESRDWSPFGTTASPWVDSIGNEHDVLLDTVYLPQALLINNTTASSSPSAGCSGEGDCDVTITVKASVETAPPLKETFKLSSYLGSDGKCDFGFRDAYMSRYSKNHDGDGLWFSGNTPEGKHAYLAVHSLGESKLSPEQVMSVCKKSIGNVFPGGAVDIKSPDSKSRVQAQAEAEVIEGHRYKLLSTTLGSDGLMTDKLPPVVSCVESSPLHFTFKAEPHHILKGTALHGVFKDSAGELWMYQEGLGEEGEFAPRLAYLAAHHMWGDMASNLRSLINE